MECLEGQPQHANSLKAVMTHTCDFVPKKATCDMDLLSIKVLTFVEYTNLPKTLTDL